MLKYLIIFITLALINMQTIAACTLPPKSSLTIGCATNCKKPYRNAIYRAASNLGYRVNIINMYNPEHETGLSRVDGFIVPGGVDIDPKYYKNKVEKKLKEHIEQLDYLVEYTENGKIRDPFEYKLWQEYFKREDTKSLPALGICRGMQMMAVSQGIPLYVDIKTELAIPNRREIHDKVKFSNGDSRIQKALNVKEFWGYKNHHQNPRADYFEKYKARWPHLSIKAYSNNGKISEVLEAKNHMAVGVQFHPEQDSGWERLRIFRWLLESACKHKNLGLTY